MNHLKNQIIFEAFDNAALSIKMILGCEAKVSKIDFTFQQENGIVNYSDIENDAVHVLKTNIAGNFSGSSYLLLGPSDVDKIFKKCLPQKVLEKDSGKNSELKGGLLLEMDNMVSAGAVTVFSNQLDTMLYGDVPQLRVLSTIDANSYIASEISNNGISNCIKAVLQIDELDIELDFIWLFEDKFFEILTASEQKVA